MTYGHGTKLDDEGVTQMIGENHWPSSNFLLRAQELYFLCLSGWNGRRVSLSDVDLALSRLQYERQELPERPVSLPNDRIDPKFTEECAAICALKGERPDEKD